MQYLADYDALEEFYSNVSDFLDSKADANHEHEKINGLKVVVSSTPVEDDSVITIVPRTYSNSIDSVSASFSSGLFKILTVSVTLESAASTSVTIEITDRTHGTSNYYAGTISSGETSGTGSLIYLTSIASGTHNGIVRLVDSTGAQVAPVAYFSSEAK